MKQIEFFYDIVCPYAYLASCQIESFAQKNKLSLTWKPILLGGLYKAHQSPQRPAQAWAEAKRKLSAQDLKRQAKRIHVALNKPPNHPMRSVEAMRALSCCPQNQLPAFSKALFKAYWVDNLDIGNSRVIDNIAAQFGLNKGIHHSEKARAQLRINTDLAIEKGLFGVPSFYCNNRFWWGQDRLMLLESSLGIDSNRWPKQIKTQETIDFYHDFSSPFSYLAFSQINRISEEYGFKVTPKPILLGALFKAIGTPNVPLLEMSQAKQAYMMQDLKDWSQYWGVDFRFPKHFPLRSVLPLRISILAPQLTRILYRAFWVEGKNIANPETIIAIAESKGLKGRELYLKAQQQGTKDRLRKNTSEAIDKGVCGVPTFDWNSNLWWGQDRLLSLVEHLTGKD